MEIIKNKLNLAVNTKKYDHIKTQADAVLYFIQHMDIEMIDAFLEDNRTYQNYEKHIFIQKLGCAFDEFKQSGDTVLKKYRGFCDSMDCNYKCKGYTFFGNNSSNYIDLIIDIKDGVVQDIYECRDFKNNNFSKTKHERIIIDTW